MLYDDLIVYVYAGSTESYTIGEYMLVWLHAIYMFCYEKFGFIVIWYAIFVWEHSIAKKSNSWTNHVVSWFIGNYSCYSGVPHISGNLAFMLFIYHSTWRWSMRWSINIIAINLIRLCGKWSVWSSFMWRLDQLSPSVRTVSTNLDDCH